MSLNLLIKLRNAENVAYGGDGIFCFSAMSQHLGKVSAWLCISTFRAERNRVMGRIAVQKAEVKGADGSRVVLAYVRETGGTVYVCAPSRLKDVEAGDDEPVVGFPREDVELVT